MEGGMRALGQVMKLRNRSSAVLCSNDMTAIGVMREAYDLGISVPAELSVVGFDDIRLSEFITPPLTTVQMSQTGLARMAFNALMNEVAQEIPSEHKKEYTLTTNLVLRRSTALAVDTARPSDQTSGSHPTARGIENEQSNRFPQKVLQ